MGQRSGVSPERSLASWPNRTRVRTVRIVRVITLPLQASVFVISELRQAYRAARHDGVDVGEALDRRIAALEAEAEEEAERDEVRRRVFEGMPPPP